MNNNYYIALDVGGTNIKAFAVGEDNAILAREKVSSRANSSKQDIFENFAAIIKNLSKDIDGNCLGIAFAFPGPFDYKLGISYMKGIGKYDSIYGLSLEENIKKHLPKEFFNLTFHYLHDVEAFAKGTIEEYREKLGNRTIEICIGTGSGSAFLEKGEVVKDGDGIPSNGWIYCYPFKESIIDDYISVRGQDLLAQKYFGSSIEGSKLHMLAEEGEEKAIDLFDEFGTNVLAALTPFIDSFTPSSLVFGGMISRSFKFFGENIRQFCNSRGIKIYIESDTSAMIAKGLISSFNGGCIC